jgi:hypothetical protein
MSHRYDPEPTKDNCSNENTLIGLAVIVFSNKDIKHFDHFNPGIIDLMFVDRMKCIKLPPNYNTLNIIIYLAGQYIESFKHDNEKLLAEQNAIKIIDIAIKHGAQVINDNVEENTLSIAMNCANINILKFLINTNLELKPSNRTNRYIDQPYDFTLYHAFKASEKTQNPEFLRIALTNGTLPCYDTSNLLNQILKSKLISEVDFIVFGGDKFIRSFFSYANNTLRSYLCSKESIETFLMFASVLDKPSITHIQYLTNFIENEGLVRIVTDYMRLISGEYLKNHEKSDEYKRIAGMKYRFETKVKWLVETAMVYDKCSERKTTIENVVLSLPISCTDIIAEYEYMPRFNVIDWSKY